MTKTLYISDLDGTLLNREGQFSDYTREALRRFDEAGILFTCATGRTLSSVSMLLGEARFTCPAVLGGAIYRARAGNSGLVCTQVATFCRPAERNGAGKGIYPT